MWVQLVFEFPVASILGMIYEQIFINMVWDVHREVYIETTERTCVYKTEEKTPTSKEEPCLYFSGPLTIIAFPLGDFTH